MTIFINQLIYKFYNHFDIHEELSTMVSNQDVSLGDFLPSEIKEIIWKYKLKT